MFNYKFNEENNFNIVETSNRIVKLSIIVLYLHVITVRFFRLTQLRYYNTTVGTHWRT